MSYRNNIDKLMQMATLDQLNYMMQQLNTNMNTNMNTSADTNRDILSLPIVQKVIIAYEEELKLKQTVEPTICKCNCRCKDIEYRLDDILLKHDEEMFEMERKIDHLTNVINTFEREKVTLNVPDSSRGIQLKLSSFPGFIRNPDIIDLTDSYSVTEDEPIIKIESETLVTDQNTVDTKFTEENITLRVEEQEQQHTVELDNIISNLESYEEEEDEDEDEDEEALEEDEDVVEDEDEDVVEDEDEDIVEEDVAVEEEAVEEDDAVDDAVEEEEADNESEEEVGTEEEEQDIKDESEIEEGIDEEVFEIEIDDVTYFASDEENGILYEVDKDGEVGKQVGIIKDGEPIFS